MTNTNKQSTDRNKLILNIYNAFNQQGGIGRIGF